MEEVGGVTTVDGAAGIGRVAVCIIRLLLMILKKEILKFLKALFIVVYVNFFTC